MASASVLPGIHLALILHQDKVSVMENKVKALITAAGVNVDPFWPSLFAKALASVSIRNHICPAAGAAPAGSPAPSTTAAPAEEEKREAKREASEESDDDMGSGLFD